MTGEQDEAERLRIDKYLFFTRFFKTRGTAGRAVSDSGVRITRNGRTRRIDKASTTVEAGDMLSFTCGKGVVALTILGLPARRGPAPEARTFYELLENSDKNGI